MKKIISLIAVAMMTAVSAMAQDILTDGDEKYVLMPDNGGAAKTVVIPNDITTLKVYDDGGKNGSYSVEYSGTLTLTAPEGCRLRITGSYELEQNYDMLTVYDGTDNTATVLKQLPTEVVDYVDLEDDDNNWVICPTIESTGRSLTLYMESDEDDSYGGLNLTVTVLHPHAPTSLTVTVDATKANVSWEASGGSYTVSYRTAAISPVVYYTGFEEYSLSDLGWTVLDADSDGNKWDDEEYEDEAHSESGYVFSNSEDDDDEDDDVNKTPDNWLISPLLPLKGTMKVWLRAQDGTLHNEHFAIYASTTGKDKANFTTTLVAETTTPDATWREYTADLSSFGENATGYIAIRHFNTTNQCGLLVDDFGIYDEGTPAGEWVNLPATTETQALIEGLTADVNYEVKVTAAMTDFPDVTSGIATFSLAAGPRNIELSNSSNNATLIKHNNGLTANVTLAGRTLYKDGSWNTLCLPFGVSSLSGTPLAGATVKTLESANFDDGTLTLNFSTSDLTAIEAGKPYIVKWASGSNAANPVFSGVTISSTSTTDVEGDAANFHGIYSPYSTGGADNTMLYLGADNMVYYPSRDITIGAFRAYFQLADGITASPNPSQGGESAVRAFVLNFGDEETGITTTNYTNVTNFSDAWYSLDGRKLNGKPTVSGIYINNGNKIVVK